MKKRIFLSLSFLALLSIPLFTSIPETNAAAATYDCNGIETSVDFHCSDNSTDGISAILMYIINIMAIGVGIAVVVGIIFGGIKYASSDGEEAKAKEGREIITNSIIGLFLFIFLYAGANFLIPGGAFNLNAKPAAVASGSGGSSGGGGSSTTPTTDRATALKALQSSSNVSNLRDAGNSGYIKTGILYRSANLNNTIGSDGKTDRDNLSVLLSGGTIIDLRQPSDGGYVQDPSISNVDNINYAIKGESSAQGYKDTFINSATARKQFAATIRAIANATTDSPILIHCKSGKDRTGWTVALVMMAVGVSKANARSEYKLSPNVDELWFNEAYKEAVKKSHSSDGTILGFMTTSVSNGGLGLSDSTIQALKDKFKL